MDEWVYRLPGKMQKRRFNKKAAITIIIKADFIDSDDVIRLNT